MTQDTKACMSFPGWQYSEHTVTSHLPEGVNAVTPGTEDNWKLHI